MKKTIELKPGYLVLDWGGKIQGVLYAELHFAEMAGEQKIQYLVCNSDGKVLYILSKYAPDKVFGDIYEAEDYAKKKKEQHIQYCQKQIERYSGFIKETNECT